MLLRKDDPWFKEMPIPDIRNWRVVDPDGNLVGFVESLAVNRESGQLEAVLTGPNERYPVDALEIGDHFVVVRSEAWWRVRSREAPSRSGAREPADPEHRE